MRPPPPSLRIYLGAQLLLLSELLLCLDVVGSGHEVASGVSAIGRQCRNAIASRRTVNGAWRLVNTRDQNEPGIVCLAVCWMLWNIIFSATFCPFQAALLSTAALPYFLSFELNYC